MVNGRVCPPMECLLQLEIPRYSRTRRELTLGWSYRGHLICLNFEFRAVVFEGQALQRESVYAQKCSLFIQSIGLKKKKKLMFHNLNISRSLIEPKTFKWLKKEFFPLHDIRCLLRQFTYRILIKNYVIGTAQFESWQNRDFQRLNNLPKVI